MSPGLWLVSCGLAPPALLRDEDLWLDVWGEYSLSDMSGFEFYLVFWSWEAEGLFTEWTVCLALLFRLKVARPGWEY